MSEKKAIDALETLKERVEDAQTALLRRRGWVHTCQTPGCYWLWTKRIEVKRTYRRGDGYEEVTAVYDALCSTQDAIMIETALILEGK